MNKLPYILAASAVLFLLQGCNPYEDEIEAARRAKEKAEQALKESEKKAKDEAEAVKEIYKEKP